jgi:hypothetical protein
VAGNASALDRSASFNYLSHSAALSFGPSCACPVSQLSVAEFAQAVLKPTNATAIYKQVPANIGGRWHDIFLQLPRAPISLEIRNLEDSPVR